MRTKFDKKIKCQDTFQFWHACMNLEERREKKMKKKNCRSLTVALPLTHAIPWTRACSDASNAIAMMMFRYWRKSHALLERGGFTPHEPTKLSYPSFSIIDFFFNFKFNLLSFNYFRSIKLNLFYKIKHQMRVIVFPQHHKIPISRQQNKNCQVKKKINVKRSIFF